MKTINNLLLIDCQGLQATSFHRGMGRYSQFLIKSIFEEGLFANYSKVVFLLNSNLVKDLAEGFLSKYCNADVVIKYIASKRQASSKADLRDQQLVLDELIDSNFPNFKVSALILSCFELDQVISVFPRNAAKFLLFYDLIPLLFPEEYLTFKPTVEDYFHRFLNLFEADHIFSISQTSKDDLIMYLNIPENKITNIGGGSIFTPNKSSQPQLPISKPFFLFPSGENWRKNNEKTIKAFSMFNVKSKFQLVVTSHFSEERERELAQGNKDVVFSDLVSDEELRWLYENAQAIVFPSVYEGLGLPILEAVNFNKAILASKIPVFQEFSLNSFVWCDHSDVKSIASGFSTVANYKPDKNKYQKILSDFNWQKTANTLKSSIEKHEDLKRNVFKKKKKKIALVGPSPSGYSAIGKFCQELLPAISETTEVDFYYEMPIGLKSYKLSYAQNVWNSRPVSELRDNVSLYNQVIYNIGNSEYHPQTLLLALKFPDTIILHDIDLSGLNNILERDFPEWKMRRKIELALEASFDLHKPAQEIISLINLQKTVIAHSDYSSNLVSKMIFSNTIVKNLNLPITASKYLTKNTNEKKVIAIAGLISDEKGGKIIFDIIRNHHSEFTFIFFGFTFFDNSFLDIKALADQGFIQIFNNVSDFKYSELLNKSDFLLNLRPNYRGEASRTVLEALRYGVIPIVNNIGWFAELPNEIVIKINNDFELLSLFRTPTTLNNISKTFSRDHVEKYLININYNKYAKNLINRL